MTLGNMRQNGVRAVIADINRIIAEHEENEVQRARDNPVAPHGGIREPAGQGSHPTLVDRGRTYALRRPARDRPDLLDAVERGEMSANAAAIEAGWRRPPQATRFATHNRC